MTRMPELQWILTHRRKAEWPPCVHCKGCHPAPTLPKPFTAPDIEQSRGCYKLYNYILSPYFSVPHQDEIYMYGGKIETSGGNVTNELWVFDISSKSWSTRTPLVLNHGQHYAVEGHAAHILELDTREVVMVIIFGYSSVYGYISNVQEYYLSESCADWGRFMI